MAKKRDNYTALEFRASAKALMFLKDVALDVAMVTDVPFSTVVAVNLTKDNDVELSPLQMDIETTAGRVMLADMVKAYSSVLAPDPTTRPILSAYALPTPSGGHVGMTTSPIATTDYVGVRAAQTKFEYRKAMIEAGQEFIFESGYIGSSGNLIVRATPVDAQKFILAEYKDEELDRIFPDFSYHLVKRIEKENKRLAQRVHRDDSTGAVFETIFAYFVAEEEEILEQIKAEELARKLEAEREMEELPTWGIF